MKDNAKCKNSHFEPPFGGLMGNTQGSSTARWKTHCRLPISDNWTFFASFHGCGTVKQNLLKSTFSEGVGHFERKFYVDEDVASNPSMDRYTEERCSYNFVAGSFHMSVADVFDRSWILLAKTAKSRFVLPFGGLRGNVHGSSMA